MSGTASECLTASIAAPCCAMIGPAVRPAAGVRELHADDEPVGRPEPRAARGARLVEKPLQLRRVRGLR